MSSLGHRISVSLAIAAAVTAFACDEPTPAQTTQAPDDSPEVVAEPIPLELVEHTIARGETLWHLSQRYGVSLAEIQRENGLSDREARSLSAGTVVRIPGVFAGADAAAEPEEPEEARVPPPPATVGVDPATDGADHQLWPGETIWELARLYEIEADAIVERNHFTDDDVRSLRAGKTLIIPGITPDGVKHADPAPARSARAPRRGKGLEHRLRRGETLWDIARRYQVSVAELMSANELGVPEVRALQEGSKVFVPGVTAATREHRRQLTPAQLRDLDRARRLGLGTRQAASRLLGGHVEARWQAAAGGDRLPRTLRWPVTNGRFVRGYGSGTGGYHLAVDISGDIGWNVRAAADGIVAYSDDTVRGYGNMVLVVHPGGWVTMYAHNSVNFVVAGQRVRAGAILAELGSTGISRGPHVHFEFMYDGRNCDPAALFRPGVRHAHRLARIEQATWTRAGDKPSAVQCAPRRRHPHSRYVENE